MWRSAGGYPIGYSAPLASAGLQARRQQYAAADGHAGLAIARELVAARIENTREFLRRRTFDARDKVRRGLEVAARKALHARNTAKLRGHEGAATALYFSALDDLLGARAGEIVFAGRSRRPPGDAVNAMLSYAYAVLAGECLCAAAASGLDPRLGFMHAERAGRPALALDLMEPFRPLVADAAVIGGLNRGQFSENEFSAGPNGIAMSQAARRTLIQLIEQRLDGQAVYHETSGFAQSYRQIIGLEARRLAHCLTQGSTFKAWRAT